MHGGSSHQNFMQENESGCRSNPALSGQVEGLMSSAEQYKHVPISSVARIMHRVLPTQAKISDEAKEAMLECISKFIHVITAEANRQRQQLCRVTLTADDILRAMSRLGLNDFIEPLSVFLSRYRENAADQHGYTRGEPLQLFDNCNRGEYRFTTQVPAFSMTTAAATAVTNDHEMPARVCMQQSANQMLQQQQQ